MKQRRTRHTVRSTALRNCPAYPNAADNRYFADKAVELLSAIVSGSGAMAIMVFFLVALS